MATSASALQLKMFVILCLGMLVSSCDNSPPFGYIYANPEFEYYIQLSPINDTNWVCVGSRRTDPLGKSNGLYQYMDAEFNVIWERTYEGEAFEIASKIIPVDSGYLLLGHTHFSSGREGDSRVVYVDSSGREVWNSIIGGKGSDHLFEAVNARGGGYLLVGNTAGDSSMGFNGWLVKLEGDGQQQWTRSFGKSGSLRGDYFSSIQQIPGGGYLISGYTASFGAGSFDAWLFKIDENGYEEWSQTYGGEGKEFIGKPLLLDDGGFLIYGGTKERANGKNRGWVFKTDSQGTVLWSQYYDRITGISSLIPFRSDGYLLLGASKESENDGSDVGLCRIDSLGEKVWIRRMGGEESDYGLWIYNVLDGFRIIASTNSFGEGWSNWVIDLDREGNPL